VFIWQVIRTGQKQYAQENGTKEKITTTKIIRMRRRSTEVRPVIGR